MTTATRKRRLFMLHKLGASAFKAAGEMLAAR